jgi:hypothetical protein
MDYSGPQVELDEAVMKYDNVHCISNAADVIGGRSGKHKEEKGKKRYVEWVRTQKTHGSKYVTGCPESRLGSQQF